MIRLPALSPIRASLSSKTVWPSNEAGPRPLPTPRNLQNSAPAGQNSRPLFGANRNRQEGGQARRQVCAPMPSLRAECHLIASSFVKNEPILRHGKIDINTIANSTSTKIRQIVRHRPRCWPCLANYSASTAPAFKPQSLKRQWFTANQQL